ncbi:MAG: putative membrane protein [Paraglaciecola sp.]|jgi:uncharacterized membrane protein
MSQRFFALDVLRGTAIVLMVIFHFCFDLTEFAYADFNITSDIYWRIFRAIIVSGFLLAVGMSSYLAYAKQIIWGKFFRTLGLLLISALAITVGSLLMYPDKWVYFGILHFIALALLLSLIFVRVPRLSLVLGVLMISSYFLWGVDLHPLWQWSVERLSIPKRTADLVSFTPWFGVVLIGIYMMHRNMWGVDIKPNRFTGLLSYLGRHSLIIYLLHQPVLYLGFSLVGVSFA